MSNIFSGLENMGFGNLSGIELYKKPEQNQVKSEKTKKMSYIYDKTVKCPVCQKETKIKATKKGSYRLTRQDSDLMNHYDGINPMFYSMTFCSECGYTALANTFFNLKDYQIEAIRQKISANWKKPSYPKEEYDLEFAMQQHKLALLNAAVKEAKSSEKALICLKLSWLCRMKEDQDNEKRFQQMALMGFEDAYNVEAFPLTGGLEKYQTLYLIGELHRRLGNYENSLRYFSEVITSPNVGQKLKDKAREQKDLLREQMENMNS